MIAMNNGGFPWRAPATGKAYSEGLARHQKGEISIEELRALGDRAVREAIEAQIRSGLDLVTDGLVRRVDPVSHVAAQLTGISDGADGGRFPGSGAPCRTLVAEDEVAWNAPILVEDYLFASQGAAKPVKIVMAGPYTLAGLTEDRVYGDARTLAMAFATALNQELRALQAAGASFFQIDEPALLATPQDFPIFTRIWEVLGRGISSTLCLNLQGGDVGQLYPGIARLKRLGCLSLDCVAGTNNIDLLRHDSPPEDLTIALGVIDGGREIVETSADIVKIVGGAGGLPQGERLLLATASDLGDLAPETATTKLKALSDAARAMERA